MKIIVSAEGSTTWARDTYKNLWKRNFSDSCKVAFASCTLSDAETPYGLPCLSALRKAGIFYAVT